VKWELKSDRPDSVNGTGFILHNISHVVYRDIEDWCIRYRTEFTDVFVDVGQMEKGLRIAEWPTLTWPKVTVPTPYDLAKLYAFDF
jgi:hypothetical protein